MSILSKNIYKLNNGNFSFRLTYKIKQGKITIRLLVAKFLSKKIEDCANKTMKFEFIAEWGFKHIYFRESYLPTIDFGGNISVKNGRLVDTQRVIFKKDKFGTHVQSPIFTPYGKAEWESKVCNNFDGFLFTVDGDENTEIEISTSSANGKFTINELLNKEHLVYDTYNPFLFAVMHVYFKNHEWYLAKVKENEVRIKGDMFSGSQNSFFGVNGVVIPCGESVKATFNHEEISVDEQTTIRATGTIRAIQSLSAETDECAQGVADYTVKINGITIYSNDKFHYQWDDHSVNLEENFFDFSYDLLKSGENTIEIINNDKSIVVLAQMVRLFIKPIRHLDIVRCPKWTVKGNPFSVKIFTARPTIIDIESSFARLVSPDGQYQAQSTSSILTGKGETEFFFVADEVGANTEIKFRDKKNGAESIAVIEQVWAESKEQDIPKTGIEIKLDQPQDYQRLLDLMIDEQMGNYALFRSYRYDDPSLSTLFDVASNCKKHQVYTDIVILKPTCRAIASAIKEGSKEYHFAVGSHERTGIFYWGEFFDNPEINTMEDAENASIKALEKFVDDLRVGDATIAVGDASGGARYAYQAGFDCLRHETYCGHHLTTLPIARGVARAYNKPIWGAHVASQHNIQNELETALGRYWISMFLPYVFGANFAYEEDSLFQNNKYYRMANDDYMTLGKQIVTKDYYKHIQTHSRVGTPQVDIAFIQGRHEAPFTALATCNGSLPIIHPEEDQRIWGKNGSPKEEWGHRQPEKGWHLLETVAPQIYVPPLKQNPSKVRKVFSSNPYGEFDFLPIEAPQNVYNQYKILFMIGWNTMRDNAKGINDNFINDYQRLKNYVENGGVIILSVPQLSKRTDREFLSDIKNADLYNGGDVADLFGARIGSACEQISKAVAVGDFPVKDYNTDETLIRLPSKHEDEDGDCCLANLELCGAEVVLKDQASGKPLLIRHKVGLGYAYLLCTYAYPGHEKLKHIAPNIIRSLIDIHVKKDVFVKDETNQTYWSDWKHQAGGKLYLINIDWTKIDNQNKVSVQIYDDNFDCVVKERQLLEIAYQKGSAVYSHHNDVDICALGNGKYSLCGFGEFDLVLRSTKNSTVLLNDTELGQVKNGEITVKVSLQGQAQLEFIEK